MASATSHALVPPDARMGPGVAGMPSTEAGALTRRTSRASEAMSAKEGDLRGMIAAHVRQCGTTGAAMHTIVVERDDPLQCMVGKSLSQIRCCDQLRIDFV